ncbi:MAG: hypothetical protein AAF628_14690 [Planctomycetota bacterium]
MNLPSHRAVSPWWAPAALVALASLTPAQSPALINNLYDNYREPDVAYDATTDTYLVVWESSWEFWQREVSGGSTFIRDVYEIRGQFVDSTGNPVGTSFLVTDFKVDGFRPRVANLNKTDRFLVTWEEASNNGDIYARTIDAATGVLSARVPVANTVAAEVQPVVAGEASTLDDDAVVVWLNQSQGVILACEVTAAAPGVVPAVGPPTAVTAGKVRHPAVAASGDLAGRLLVAWTQDDGPRGEIFGRFIDRSAQRLTLPFPIYEGTDAAWPAVAGDGTSWVVAFQHREGGILNFDIAAQVVRYDPVSASEYLFGGTQPVAAAPNHNETRPAVAWIGESVKVGWKEDFAQGSQIHAKTIDPHTCIRCEPEFVVDTGTDAAWPAIASEMTAELGSKSNGALHVFVQDDAVYGDLFHARDGLVTDVGGACGQGGTPDATCVVAPNAAFRFRVLHSHASQSAFMILSGARLDAALPPSCTLVPDPLLGVILGSGTSAQGNAALLVPIPDNPALIGARLFAQWGVTGGSGSLGLDFSNALRVRIG